MKQIVSTLPIGNSLREFYLSRNAVFPEIFSLGKTKLAFSFTFHLKFREFLGHSNHQKTRVLPPPGPPLAWCSTPLRAINKQTQHKAHTLFRINAAYCTTEPEKQKGQELRKMKSSMVKGRNQDLKMNK